MFTRVFSRNNQLLRKTQSPLSTSSILSRRSKLILGLESSADDTCAAVLRDDGHSLSEGPIQILSNITILSNIVLKQDHERDGGIHPLTAQNLHQERMGTAIQMALKEAQCSVKDLNFVAYSKGPGMFGCLAVSATSAKAISAVAGIPILGVHHMQAHALTVFLTEKVPPTFPFLCLLLSGGHTLLLMVKSESNFTILATTHDESIGMSFDKACRDLKIDWSTGSNGSPGAALEACADFNNHSTAIDDSLIPLPSFRIPFPKELKFSYAGLRSALTRQINLESPVISEGRRSKLAKLFMSAAFDQVAEKVKIGLENTTVPLGGLVVSGGVAANQYLRTKLRDTLDRLGHQQLPLFFPPPELCTDNAAMIANVGISRLRRGRIDGIQTMQKAKWSIEECEKDFEQQ